MTELYTTHAPKLRSLFSHKPSMDFIIEGKESPKYFLDHFKDLQDETSWQVSSQQKVLRELKERVSTTSN